MRWILVCVLPTSFLLVPLCAVGQPQQPLPTEKKTKPKTESPPAAPTPIEQLIAEALRNNPDIRVAEAKLRESESERDRTRLKVAADIGAVHAELQAAGAALAEGRDRYERAKGLHQNKAISAEDLGAARLTFVKLQAELASAEARLPFLLGKQPAVAATVDQLIADALKNNPDIRVAEAKLREAESERDRTRLKVAADVSALHADLQAARATLAEGASRYDRAKELEKRKAISVEDLSVARLTYLKFQAELAGAEAKLPYLLGRQPGAGATQGVIDDLIKKKWLASGKDTNVTDEEFLRRVMLDVYGRLPTPAETKDFLKLPEKDRRERWLDQIATPKGDRLSIRHDLAAWVGATCIQCHTTPVRLHAVDAWMGHHDMWAKLLTDSHAKSATPATEKLRKALDGKIRVAFDKTPISDVMEFLHDKALPDVNLVLRGKARTNLPVTVKLEAPVPVGAVLQCLEDELNIVFVLREYGIVVVSAEDRLPPGAVRVVDFWKRGKSAEPPAANKEKSKTPAAEKKTGDIRGARQKIDANGQALVALTGLRIAHPPLFLRNSSREELHR